MDVGVEIDGYRVVRLLGSGGTADSWLADDPVSGRQWVLNEAGMPVNELWQESDRPAYCGVCGWHGPMRETIRIEEECKRFRGPACRSWVANRLGEG
jgi:hypothetical protein